MARPLSAERFADAFDRVHAAVEALLAAGAIDMHTTYFETVTAMALLVFAEERVDMVVLEVGLGGRLDATNVVIPELCGDHAHGFRPRGFLGRSLESIAGEKAGILKPGVPAVFRAAAAGSRARCWTAARRSSASRWRAPKSGRCAIWNWTRAAAAFALAGEPRSFAFAVRWPASTRWKMP